MLNLDIVSVEELLAMPDDHYMNPQQLAFFQRLLEQQLAHIRHNAAETSKHLREHEEFPDPADRATQEELHTLELRTRDRERKLEKKINAALQRIRDGEYGYCEESGEPIGLQRLLARPTATLALEAQERHERRERQYSH
ncbi:RNA polymerase-binding protein DksA [Methylobacillus flagellatus]|uniref:RNA polymerase-binding transcription factor DksA n=1 Tax=Methylobacillus flagellatus (strain ATCC 51484 / DSM 6875 / VKM B-1610 / KT) TaxID=265072 RepID=Q1H1Y7_METFK|nr:RNA polymerase-binding protein DksA [Methylobacillus flagellatus]ABE49500.1 transcriptional regulator, TraR/DksA family [Methylobacillus flagellatus KT]